VKHGFAFEGQYFSDELPGPVLVTPGNFRIGGGFNRQALKYYHGDIPRGYELSPGDLVVTMTDLSKSGDTLGYAARIPNDGRRYLHNQRIGKILDSSKGSLSLDFAYWLLRSSDYRAEVLAGATGSTVRHTSPSRIKAFRFHLPTFPEQVEIAGLLSALEEKIEVSRRMAETLEAMARALFKSWFVDFDPVHARAERRPTGLPDDLAALFPNSFGADAVPDSWVKRPMSALGQFLNGLALQKHPVAEGEAYLPVIKIAELRTGPTPRSDRASVSLPAEYVVRDGDHLFSWSGSLMHCRWSYGPGALNQHLFKVTATACPSWFLFQAVDHFLPEFRSIASDKAVTMGHIQRRHLDEALIAVPQPVLMDAANRLLGPIHERVLTLALQCRTLAALRDALLPKLISGELRIADAEQRVAAA
jgi:type I restriction enzyme S subunit